MPFSYLVTPIRVAHKKFSFIPPTYELLSFYRAFRRPKNHEPFLLKQNFEEEIWLALVVEIRRQTLFGKVFGGLKRINERIFPAI